MKRKGTLLILLGGLIAIMFLQGNSSGAPAGRTGAPGEQSCGTSSCHNATDNEGSATIDITIDEGVENYTPGMTHKLTMSISSAMNDAKNGFEVTALDADNNFIGSFQLIDENLTRQRSLNNRNYITHSFEGSSLTSWEVNWVAPDMDSGDITFYLAVNDANNNGGRTGDDIYTTSKTVSANTTSSINILEGSNVNVYPVPANTVLNVVNTVYQLEKYAIYDFNGKLVQSSILQNEINVSGLPAGGYVLKLSGSSGVVVKNIQINR